MNAYQPTIACGPWPPAGFIHFNEFLAATIQQRQLDEAQLWPAFDRLDRSHTGFINLDDVTLTTGAAATKQEAAVLVSYFDINGDGQVRALSRPSVTKRKPPATPIAVLIFRGCSYSSAREK